MIYDYLIVGAGLYGSVCARILTDNGYRCLVVERRNHIGGNCYTEHRDGITVHKYGAHIFHTNSDEAWEFVNKYAKFMPIAHAPVANYKGEIYNLPFNMNTFAKLWNVVLPEEARKKIQSQCIPLPEGMKPETVEELALYTCGRDIYEKLIKGYTEKQWGKSCAELPADILGRIPLRFIYDNNCFDAKYQGIPEEGYASRLNEMTIGYSELTKLIDTECDATLVLGAAKSDAGSYYDYATGVLHSCRIYYILLLCLPCWLRPP